MYMPFTVLKLFYNSVSYGKLIGYCQTLAILNNKHRMIPHLRCYFRRLSEWLWF